MKPSPRPLAVLLATLTLASQATAAPVTWKVDKAHTEVGFEVRHFFSKVHGVFHDMQGTIVFDDQDPTAITVDASARVASVDTGNRNRDADLQSPDFFNAATDSILSFKSTKERRWARPSTRSPATSPCAGSRNRSCSTPSSWARRT